MHHQLLSVIVVMSLAGAQGFAGEAPRNALFIEGQLTDKDSRVKFQLDAKSAKEMCEDV